MGDDFFLSDPETKLVRYTGQLQDPEANPTDVLTVDADGYISAQPAAAGGVGTITSTDTSVTVTDPTGPSTDLAVANSPKVGGITVTGTPSSGQVLVASGATAAAWGSLVAALEVLTTLTVDQAAPGGGDVELHSAPPGTDGYVQINGGSGQTTQALLKAHTTGGTIVFVVTNDAKVGFYGASPVALQTGVAVTAAAVHAALVNLGLITA